jgi:hypothetical protein
VGHLSDTERIFSYRALCLARNDTARATALPGFEQDDYVRSGEFNARTLSSLLDELAAVRESRLELFRNVPHDAWLHRGIVNQWNVTVRGLAFYAAGHELHCQDSPRTVSMMLVFRLTKRQCEDLTGPAQPPFGTLSYKFNRTLSQGQRRRTTRGVDHRSRLWASPRPHSARVSHLQFALILCRSAFIVFARAIIPSIS